MEMVAKLFSHRTACPPPITRHNAIKDNINSARLHNIHVNRPRVRSDVTAVTFRMLDKGSFDQHSWHSKERKCSCKQRGPGAQDVLEATPSNLEAMRHPFRMHSAHV